MKSSAFKISAAAVLVVAGLSTLPVPSAAQRGASRGDLAAAERAAWGRAGGTTLTVDTKVSTGRASWSRVAYSKGRLVQAPFGPILVAEGQVVDAGHVHPGAVGAFYLRRTARGFVKGRAYPGALLTGSFGNVGEWSMSNRFGPNPVIYAEGGFTGQGITCGVTTLVELTPAGPVEIANIPTSFDNSGYGRGTIRSTQGKIANVVPGRSFNVVYSGSQRYTERYVRSGGKYRLAGRAKPRLDGC